MRSKAWLCFPLRGNVPLREDLVWILLTYAERCGLFKLISETLIKASAETFGDPSKI